MPDQIANLKEESFELHIKSNNKSFSLNLKDIWTYRDLLWLLVRRDFVSFYKQTLLGPLWFFIQPMLTTIMYTIIFGRLGGFSTDGLPKPLFYLTGITAWNYFADCLTKTSTVFKDNSNIFSKVYFPRLIMPLSIVVSNLIRFGVQMLLLLIIMGYYALHGTSFHLSSAIALFPIVVILMALMGLGAGMIISALTTKYRDLAFLVTFGIQLMMYATTVIYPLSSLTGKYRKLIEANPVTPLIETFRYGFLGKASFDWLSLAYSAGVTLFLLIVGIYIFNKVEKDFVDNI